jgi:centriolar protein POC1
MKQRAIVWAVLLLAASSLAAPRPKLALRETARFAAAGANIPVMRLNFSADGKSLVAATGAAEARVRSLTGDVRATYSGQRPPMFNANFSPNGGSLASTGYDGTVRLWKLADGSFRVLNLHHAAVNDVVFCGADDRLVTGSDEGVARLWNLDPHAEPKAIAEVAGPGTVRRVACNVTRALFANSFDSGEVQVTSFAGKKVVRFDTGQNRLNAIAFSPDGKRLLTGSTDGTVKLWTAEGHPLLTRRVQENGWVNDARFSPDGRLIAVATDDGHVRIYDLSGALQLDERVCAARATTVSFSPDGTMLAGASSTGEAFVYEVTHE